MLTKEFIPSSNMYRVTFEIPEQQLPQFNITSIQIVADFNNWSIRETSMRHEVGRGYVATVELAPDSTHEFRYLVNDDYWYNDWSADGYTPNRLLTADNCVCRVAAAPEPPKPTPPVVPELPEPPAVPAPPTVPAQPPVKDDLKKIDGIGPKISQLLDAGGIPTFEALSNASTDRIKEILAAAGKRYRLAVPDTWPQQAALAAQGNWEALSTLQSTLDGGKPRE